MGIILQRGNARVAIASLGQPVPETLDFDLLQAAGDFHEEAPWALNLPRHARQADIKPHGFPCFQLGTFPEAPERPDPPSEEDDGFPPHCPLAAPFFNYGGAVVPASGGSDIFHPSRPLAAPPPVAVANLAAQHLPPSSGSDPIALSRPLVEPTSSSNGAQPPSLQEAPAQHSASCGSDILVMSRPLEALISSPRSGDGAMAPHPLDVELEHAEQYVQQQAQILCGEGAPAPPQTDTLPATPPFSVASSAVAQGEDCT